MHDPLIAHRTSRGDTTVVVFAVADDLYAIPAACTREVMQWRQPRKLPGAPAWVEGVVNLRGSIIPVCDLANALNLRSERVRTEETSIIIVEAGANGECAGFTVDEVRAVTEYGADDIVDTTDADYPAMAGIVRAGENDELVVILDIQRALAGATTFIAQALGSVTDLDAAATELPTNATPTQQDTLETQLEDEREAA